MSQDIQAILAAAQYAAEKHANQRRKGDAAEPYLNHLIEVVHMVSTAHSASDASLVVAALLHDLIEDCSVTVGELTAQFAPEVTGLVLEMTDDKSLPKEDRKRLQIEHAPHLSVRAQAIKLADKISNLRSVLSSPPGNWDYERKKSYFEWAKLVVDALTAPNPVLQEEFYKTYQRFGEIRM